MNEDSGNLGHPLPKIILDGMGNDMGIAHTHIRVDTDVHVDGEIPSHPASLTFSDGFNAAYLFGEPLYLLEEEWVGSGVHQFV